MLDPQTAPDVTKRSEKFAAVDWRQTDGQIAVATGFSLETVAAERAWRAVDWSQRDPKIAAKLGVSTQAVRQQRKARAADVVIVDEPTKLEVPDRDADLIEVVRWRIAAHRKRLKLTLAAVAERIGGKWNGPWGPQQVWNVERGKRGVPPKSLFAFARALEVTPADLVLRPGQTELTEPPSVSLPVLVDPTYRQVMGRNVERWRMARGLSQGQLATKLSELDAPRALARPESWTSYDVAAVEEGLHQSGRRGMTLDSLVLFADALSVRKSKVTPADIVRLPNQPPLTIAP